MKVAYCINKMVRKNKDLGFLRIPNTIRPKILPLRITPRIQAPSNIDTLMRLFQIIIRSPNKSKIPTGKEFHPKDDNIIHDPDRTSVAQGLDILLEILKKGSPHLLQQCIEVQPFLIQKLIEQLNSDDLSERQKILCVLKIFMAGNRIYMNLIKKGIKNELIRYYCGIRHHRGVMELLDCLLNLVKRKFCESAFEKQEYFKDCVLPIFDSKLCDIIKPEFFEALLFEFIDSIHLSIVPLGYFILKISTCPQKIDTHKVKLLRYLLIHIKNHEKWKILIFSRVFNSCVLSENQILLDTITEVFFNSQINSWLVKKAKRICYLVFHSLYRSKQRYTNSKDLWKILNFIQFFIYHAKIAFQKSLISFNLTENKIDFTKKFKKIKLHQYIKENTLWSFHIKNQTKEFLKL